MHTVTVDEPQWMPSAPRGRGILAVCLLLAVAVSVWFVLRNLSAAPITSVRIAGEFVHVSRSEMQEVVNEFLPSGFFELDVDAVRREAAKIPWVRRISVRRMWPDSLHVAVVERVAVARWNGDALLEADGERFVPRQMPEQSEYASLAGPTGAEKEVLKQYELMQPIAAALNSSIAQVTLDERGAWRIELKSGLTLKLGDGDNLKPLAPYIVSLPQILGDRYDEAKNIDLRYSNGFAVEWRQEAMPEDGQPS